MHPCVSAECDSVSPMSKGSACGAGSQKRPKGSAHLVSTKISTGRAIGVSMLALWSLECESTWLSLRSGRFELILCKSQDSGQCGWPRKPNCTIRRERPDVLHSDSESSNSEGRATRAYVCFPGTLYWQASSYLY